MWIILLCVLFVTCQSKTCEKSYDECLQETSDETIGGWLSKTYSNVLERNLCLDLFKFCKNME